MTVIINAVSGSGLTQTADASGVIKLQSNGTTTNALAWVNFNGTTSPGTIRSQYNVSSVTKNGTGDYTVNFTNAMADANYASVFGGTNANGRWASLYTNTSSSAAGSQTTTSVRVWMSAGSVSPSTLDADFFNVAIFGN